MKAETKMTMVATPTKEVMLTLSEEEAKGLMLVMAWGHEIHLMCCVKRR